MVFDQLPNPEHCGGLTGKLIVMGDLNCHFQLPDKTNSRKLHEIIETFSLNQSVTKQTHKQTHALDLVFHRHNDYLQSSTKLDLRLSSDHIALRCELSIPKPVIRSELVPFRCISKISTVAFKLNTVDSITPDTSLPDLHSILYAIFRSTSESSSTENRPQGTAALLISCAHWNGNVGELRDAGTSLSSLFTKEYMKMQNAKLQNLVTMPKYPSTLQRSKLASHLKSASKPQMYSWTDQTFTTSLWLWPD